MARRATRRRAGTTTAIATRPQLVVIRGGGGGRRRRSGGRVVRVARRAGRGARKHGLPATGLAIGGLMVGYAQGSGWFDRLPSLGGDQTLALGIAGYMATRMTSNKYVREAGAAAIAVAAFETGRQHAAKSHMGGKPAVHGMGGGVGPFGGA